MSKLLKMLISVSLLMIAIIPLLRDQSLCEKNSSWKTTLDVQTEVMLHEDVGDILSPTPSEKTATIVLHPGQEILLTKYISHANIGRNGPLPNHMLGYLSDGRMIDIPIRTYYMELSSCR